MVANREKVNQYRSPCGTNVTVHAVKNQIVTNKVLAQVDATQAFLQSCHAATNFERVRYPGQEAAAQAGVLFEVFEDGLLEVIQQDGVGLRRIQFTPERLDRA